VAFGGVAEVAFVAAAEVSVQPFGDPCDVEAGAVDAVLKVSCYAAEAVGVARIGGFSATRLVPPGGARRTDPVPARCLT
jgi:hypothetical protein